MGEELDKGKRTRVPRSGLYDDTLSRNELSLLLCNLDHSLCNPIFHGASGRNVF